MKNLTPTVLLEKESFLVINKPSGWVVNDSKTSHGNNTVQEYIKKNFEFETSQDDSIRNGIVHRIDKETSGALIIAKNKKAFEALQKQFFDRVVEKTYVALVHGELKGGGEINAPIARNPLNRRHFTVLPGGRDAVTNFNVKNIYTKDNEKYSLLTLHPKTGRTHQLRVHLKHISKPIVGDPLYVGRKTLRKDLSWCPRLFLHAESVSFEDPKTNKKVLVKAPLALDLTDALKTLKKLG